MWFKSIESLNQCWLFKTTCEANAPFCVHSTSHPPSFPQLCRPKLVQQDAFSLLHPPFQPLNSDIFRNHSLISSFNDLIENLFRPLMEVTADPSSHPALHKFLQYVTGFDSVDDESKPETTFFDKDSALPQVSFIIC